MGTNDSHPEWRREHRPLRWYEWLLILFLLAAAGGVRAATVYKCIGNEGEVAYQGEPCAQATAASVIEIDPAPAWQPSPQYAHAAESPRREPRRAASRRHADAGPVSYECRAADGQVFYRHGGCPHSVAADGPGSVAPAHGAGRSGGSGGAVAVSARRVTREEACGEIHRAGAIGRSGLAHDEAISTYERNLGHDPCR